jgi:uncharacterized Rmd1/YagE family protein
LNHKQENNMDTEPLLQNKRSESKRRNYGSRNQPPSDDNDIIPIVRAPSDDEMEEPMYRADEFGNTVRNDSKAILTGRMRKKLAARLVGGEFQARRLKRRVYVCCVSSELDIQDLHDHSTQESTKWKVRLYGDALCLSSYKKGGASGSFDIPRRKVSHPHRSSSMFDDDDLGLEFMQDRKLPPATPLAKSKSAEFPTPDVVMDEVKQEIFVFEFGAVVFWGFSVGEESEVLRVIRDFSKRGDIVEREFVSSEDDMAFVAVADINSMRIANDMITLPELSTVKQRLSISYAIAQSSVVSLFEHRIEEKVTEYKFIPETLSQVGKIDLSNRRIGMMIGDIFVIRHDLNLHTDILDTPDYFWDEDRYEGDYEKMLKYLEMEGRVEVLNKRLDMLKELLDVLHTQMENAHSTKLEWIIIWLIVLEVIIQGIGSAGTFFGMWTW